ncbi:MAG: menaquinone biosynthetic enzyme MqnA/MqnD family protein, partial [Pirellulaceae bacterium]
MSYLNTKPLVYRLGEFAPEAEILYDLPSRLADQLANGSLDIGLIPSVEYFQNPAYTIVSDACIACRGPVLSVKLFSRVPIGNLQTVALDEGSRTSAALIRILLKQRFGLSPVLEPLPIGQGAEETQTDAVLLIGDRAIPPRPAEFAEEWDLGDEWCRWANLPFVFAMWVARPGMDSGRMVPALERARNEGVTHVREIAAAHAASAGLTEEDCLIYLRDNLHFQLGPRERQGLDRFC